MKKPKKKQQIQTREELIYALCRAAELEHGLVCIYLFTAFTMKKFLTEGINEIERDKIRNWQGLIFSVARQEMEHLGLVCNMLNAIGGAQHFERPNLPQPADYYGLINDFALKTFSLETMAEFMNFEKPATSSDVYADVEGDGEQIVPETIKVHDHHTVQELYDTILQGFINLNKKLGRKVLFIGPESAQIDGGDIDVNFNNSEYGITVIKITKLAEAKKAIDEIVEQGEGITLNEKFKGTSREKQIHKQYLDLDKNVQALNSIEISRKTWTKSLKQLIDLCSSISSTLKKSINLFNEPKDQKILKSVIQDVEKEKDKFQALSKKTFSPALLRQARNAQKRAFTPANFEAEGLLLSQITEADSHYLKFWEVYMDVKENNFKAGRMVVDNPMLRLHDDNQMNDDIFIVTEPYTRKAMALFNAGYETMVQMLILFFTDNGLTENEKNILMRTAFFPLMTMFTRPLGQVLTQLPADENYAKSKKVLRAGPSFEYYSDIALLAHTPPNWIYLNERLEEMAALAKELRKPPKKLRQFLASEKQLKEVIYQMNYLHTNIVRMAANFANGMNLKSK